MSNENNLVAPYSRQLLENASDRCLAELWQHHCILGKSQFCRQFGINQGNFSQWLQTKKHSFVSRRAVIDFLSGIYELKDVKPSVAQIINQNDKILNHNNNKKTQTDEIVNISISHYTYQTEKKQTVQVFNHKDDQCKYSGEVVHHNKKVHQIEKKQTVQVFNHKDDQCKYSGEVVHHNKKVHQIEKIQTVQVFNHKDDQCKYSGEVVHHNKKVHQIEKIQTVQVFNHKDDQCKYSGEVVHHNQNEHETEKIQTENRVEIYPCVHFEKGLCVAGDLCQYSHAALPQKKKLQQQESIRNLLLTKEKTLKTIFLIDGDNCRSIIDQLRRFLANQPLEKLAAISNIWHAISFHVPQHCPRGTIFSNFITHISAVSNTKDAVDISLSMEAAVLDYTLPKHIEFLILSSDWFAVETSLKLKIGERSCKVFDPNIREHRILLNFLSPDPSLTRHSENSYSIENQDDKFSFQLERLQIKNKEKEEELRKLLDQVKQQLNLPRPDMIYVSRLGQLVPLDEQQRRRFSSWANILRTPFAQEYLCVERVDLGNGVWGIKCLNVIN
eukprot:TRINITY_DN1202_c0_g1_i11.p1 TRINITY_DN1202_c0_g1~~TRINITY_DN1202_c0_g1_i11.p1  ORF type:complete len:555 (+),score=46.69 TRINITY_DN1202_c0_g1_i11:55-1719(+)